MELAPLPVLREQLMGRVPIEHVGDNWYVAMPVRHPGTGTAWPLVKRAFDIVSAGLALWNTLYNDYSEVLECTIPHRAGGGDPILPAPPRGRSNAISL